MTSASLGGVALSPSQLMYDSDGSGAADAQKTLWNMSASDADFGTQLQKAGDALTIRAEMKVTTQQQAVDCSEVCCSVM